MSRRIIAVPALLLTALMLAPIGAHLFALPNKIGMSRDQYLVAQSIHQGWAWFGLVMIPAVGINALYASLLRRPRAAFALAVAGGVCIAAATLVIFFAWAFPANVATQN